MRRSSGQGWPATVAGALVVYATAPLAALVWIIGLLLRMMRKRLFWIVIVVLVPVLYCGGWLWTSSGDAEQATELEVRAGTSFASFTDSLAVRGVIDKPNLFRVAARISGIDRQLHVGLYRFAPEDSPWNVLRRLARHEQIYLRFTVIEGSTLREMIPEISAQLDIPKDLLWAEVRDPERLARLGIETEYLEGYLFPETYTVRWGADAAEVVDAMRGQFDTVWEDISDSYAGSLTRHQAVTLASLIEAEARDGSERGTISSVFHNRLDRRMKLQCDPTVIYAMGGLDRPLMRKDWEYDSPYNTYRIRGLPPGPIGAPGRASLQAALYPGSTDYFYFVARGDGTHEFNLTLAEHEAAFRRIKREQRKRP